MEMTHAFERQFKGFLESTLADSVSEKDPRMYLAGLEAEYKQNGEPVMELPKRLTKSGNTEIFIYGVDKENDCLLTRDEYYAKQPVSTQLRREINKHRYRSASQRKKPDVQER
jgi:hypothetical protein